MCINAAGGDAGSILRFPSGPHGASFFLRRNLLSGLALSAMLAFSAVAHATSGDPQQRDADMSVSLRIVERCDPAAAVAPGQGCDTADYDRWLRTHAAPVRSVVDEQGRQVLEVRF